ncbi:hypothetical protein U14_03496 [Candidatus Moduliflexus flocculans]|uniref:Uncharacterized protein n=1 Tax=Candidatus Moduliflexus flocculans TaxID=1499966 RepID=A0A081BPC9_9BACT|nr:hypothetical protein U14_03496 [Candidatus Moduliflexus flocculans]
MYYIELICQENFMKIKKFRNPLDVMTQEVVGREKLSDTFKVSDSSVHNVLCQYSRNKEREKEEKFNAERAVSPSKRSRKKHLTGF